MSQFTDIRTALHCQRSQRAYVGAVKDERTLLLVEDDVDLRDNLAEILEQHGYRVHGASSAQEALKRVEHVAISAVLTDFRLVQGTGIELIGALRERGVTAPVVMLSALLDGPLKEQALRAGAVGILRKPVDLNRLFGLLQSCTGMEPDANP